MRLPLTARQNQIYELIRAHLRDHGQPPTIHEMCEQLGVRSTNAVFKQLKALEHKGYITRERHAARSIELTEPEDDPRQKTEAPSVLLLQDHMPGARSDALRLHVRGALTVDGHFLRDAPADACLAVRSADDGMGAFGIGKGDVLIVHQREVGDLRDGYLTAVVVDGQPLARRFAYRAGRLHFDAAAKTYPSHRFLPADDGYALIGKIVAVMRRL
jgi:repressor LexA